MEYTNLREQVYKILSQDVVLEEEDNLLEKGMNSLQIMRFVNQLRKQRIKISFGELMEEPTLAAWMQLINKRKPVEKKVEKKTSEVALNTPFPMTDVQYAYWIGRNDDQVLGGVGCHAYLEFDGEGVDPEKLEAAWKVLENHHPMLRARFLEDGTQEIMKEPYSSKIQVIDLKDQEEMEWKSKLEKVRETLSHRKLHIEKGEVAGITLCLLPDNKTKIHLDIDLTVADVQSLQIIIRDLAEAYVGNELPKESYHWDFAGYLANQEKEDVEEKQAAKKYWKERLESLPNGPELSLKKHPEDITSTKFSRRICRLNKDEWATLKQKAAAYKTTPAMLLLTAYSTVLERWSSNKKFLINIPVFNRKTEIDGIEDVIADFTTLLLLEIDCQGNPTFLNLLRRVETQLHQDMKYSSYSGVQVQRDLAQLRKGQASTAPIVFACNLGTELVNENFRSNLGDFSYMISQTPQVWLDFQTYEDKNGLMLTWDTVEELFPENMIQEMMNSFDGLLHALVNEDWNRCFDVLPKSRKLFIEGECQVGELEEECCLHQAFMKHAEEQPEAVAIVDTGNQISFTYGELRERVLSIAAAICQMGICNEPIAITLPRGYKQVESVLAILQSGNFYVPVSIAQPDDRRNLIHEKMGIRYVITDRSVKDKISWQDNVSILELEQLEEGQRLWEYPEVSPENTAYIIMTSGTTGVPKGVEIAHRSAWNTITDINNKYGIGSEDTGFAISSIDFDLSVYDVFGILGAGGTLIVIPDAERKNAEYWLAQVMKYGVTVWNSVPVLLDMLLISAEAQNKQLPIKTVMLSGDWIGMDLPKRLDDRTTDCKFVAMGGATEASIWSNYQDVVLPLPIEWNTIPYGKSLKGQAYRVVDSNGKDCPCWVEGELWIGGYGVAKGYRGDEELTKEKFVEDNLGRWYRTGDKGRYWNDGIIEFLGRKDNQVKIRGHRIEIGEIEHALKQNDGVKNVIVDAVGEKTGDKYLAAYVVGELLEESSISKWTTRSIGMNDVWKTISQENKAEDSNRKKEYEKAMDCANKVCVDVMKNTFSMLNLPESSGGKFYSLQEMMKLMSICGQWENTLKRWLKLCVAEAVMEESQGTYRWDNINKTDIAYASKYAFYDYIKKISEYLPSIVSGSADAMEVYYKENEGLTPNDLLKCIPGYEEMMESVINAVHQIREKAEVEKTIRVLEFGTRDSAISLMIQKELEGTSVQYTYGDVSQYFINDAKHALEHYENIEYKVFDLNRGINEQDIPLHNFDFILTLNSIHRVSNVKNAVKAIKDLLAPEGILCLQELSDNTYLQEITASLLEKGFTTFQDLRSQQEDVLLSSQQWKEMFQEEFSFIATWKQYGRTVLYAKQEEQVLSYSAEKLQKSLREKLPEYMIPRAFYFMERFPMTKNGKVDRKFLRSRYQANKVENHKESAATDTEKKLLAIWKEIFQSKSIGILDNYFSLGGDSLVATRMIAKVRDSFQCEISISKVFDKATVRDLAKEIDLIRKEEHTQQGRQELPQIIPDKENQNIPFPLTDVQYAYWVGRNGMYDLGNVATHCYFELNTKDLNIEKAQDALNVLIKEHGMMRSVIMADGQQKILASVPEFKIKVHDISALSSTEQEKELEKQRDIMSHQVIDTETWPLYDIRITNIDNQNARIHISFDNIIFDGWSMFHVLKEWADVYYGRKQEKEMEFSFRDYVLGLEEIKNSTVYAEDEKYWCNRLDTFQDAPQLPLAKRENEIENQRFCRRTGTLSKAEWSSLRKKAGQLGITPSVLLITSYAEVLRLWSLNDDFTINLTQFNRIPLHPDVNHLVGDFTTLTLLEIKDAVQCRNFAERCRKVQNQLSKDMEHSFYSAIEVERKLKQKNGNGKGSVMPIVFTSGLGIEQWNDGKWLGTLNYNISQTPQVWLDHQVIEMDGELCLFWDSVDELFYPGMLDEMFAAYVRLLKGLAADEHLFGAEKTSLVETQISDVRRQANETGKEMGFCSLDTMFLKSCELYPDKEALVTPTRRMTYREIKEEAYFLCEQLNKLQVSKNETVAIIMNKDWQQIVAVYGILFAGGAYLPIDASNPEERIRKILVDSKTRVVLGQEAILEKATWLNEWECIAVKGEKESASPQIAENGKDDLAYVIYTSGTTGMPKGVMISHQGAANTILDIIKTYHVESSDTAFAISNLHFDLSVFDIFGLLGCGGKIVIPDDTRAKEPAHWVELLNQEHITIWNSVPAFMEMLIEYEEHQKMVKEDSLKLVLLSGDWIPLTLPGRINHTFQSAKVISLGGATEASIWSNHFPVPESIPENWKSIPYGIPLSNQKYYVLDSNLNDCPDWVIGTLYIGGLGVALGYLNDKERTEEKFIVHPKTGERLYCTGDLGRYWNDGNIEFLGRIDNQVKINGYRVELGEIKNAILSTQKVNETEIVLNNKNQIIAFISQCKAIQDNAGEEWTGLAVLEEAVEHASDEIKKKSRKGFSEFESAINGVCLATMTSTLKKLGMNSSMRGLSKQEYLKVLNIRDEFSELMLIWLDILVQNQIVTKKEEQYDFANLDYQFAPIKLERRDLQEAILTLSKDLDNNIDVCIRIMREKGVSVEALVNKEFTLTADVLEKYNLLGADVTVQMFSILKSLVEEKGKDVIVVEIGNRMNKHIDKYLEILDGKGEYWLVDSQIDADFVEQAKTTANFYTAEYNIQDTKLYNGELKQKADILILDNVLHRAHDVKFALENIDRVLKPNGILLLREYSNTNMLMYNTVAFLEEGFSDITDWRKKKASPLLTKEEWEKELCEIGLKWKTGFRVEDSEYAGAGECIIFGYKSQLNYRELEEEIRSMTKNSLPEYMLPEEIYYIHQIPLSQNGKVDAKKLNEYINDNAYEEEAVVPEDLSPEERQMMDIWERVLECPVHSVHKKFFECGGDSLKAIKLINCVKEELNKEIKLSSLFDNPDIASILSRLENVERTAFVEEEGVI